MSGGRGDGTLPVPSGTHTNCGGHVDQGSCDGCGADCLTDDQVNGGDGK